MRPALQYLIRSQPDRLLSTIHLSGECFEETGRFIRLNAAPEGEGTELVYVQAGGEATQKIIRGVGSDTADLEAVTPHVDLEALRLPERDIQMLLELLSHWGTCP